MSDQFQLARALGALEATVKDLGRRVTTLERRKPEGVPWKELMPYLYGIILVIAALVAVLSGKISAIDAISAIQSGRH